MPRLAIPAPICCGKEMEKAVEKAVYRCVNPGCGREWSYLTWMRSTPEYQQNLMMDLEARLEKISQMVDRLLVIS